MSDSTEPNTNSNDSTVHRRAFELAWTSTAYFGEGLPYSFLHQLISQYLTSVGAPARVVGATSWFHAPVIAKSAIAPLIDRVGRRRLVMLALQFVLGLLMIATGWIIADPDPAYQALVSILIALAILHAVHDIACDGFFIIALSPASQALYSGSRIAAFRAAMYVGSGLLVVLASRTSWPIALSTAGALMIAVSGINSILIPQLVEPRIESTSLGRSWVHTYRSLLSQPRIGLVLAFILTYRIGDTLTFAMGPVLLRSLGMGDEARGWLAMIGLTASIVGSLGAGVLIARDGLERWFAPFTWAMAMPFYLILTLVQPSVYLIASVVAVEQLAGAFAGTALPVFLIRRSRRAYSASDYAILSSLVAIASTAVGGFSGFINETLGQIGYFSLCFFASIPALLLVRLVPTTPIDPSAPIGEPTKPN